jgi:hypothetical protein
MARALLAVLVSHTAAVDSIEVHLAGPMRPLIASATFDSYHFGGDCTGAWDPG